VKEATAPFHSLHRTGAALRFFRFQRLASGPGRWLVRSAARRWNVPDNLEPGPFSEFAAPKKGAVEQWRERQEKARRRRRQVIRGLCCLVAGAALGTGAGVCVHEGIRPLPLVFVAALLGAALGNLIGVLVGCACFSVMAMARTRFGPSFESELARRDPMSVITVLVVAFGLIGTIGGAAWGGLVGISWFLGEGVNDEDWAGALAGAFAGVVLAGIGWLLWIRSRRSDSPADRQTSDAEPGAAADRPRD
jgi:MFS family permease